MNTWIETADGRQIPIDAHCSFGRAQGASVRLASPAASRKHAYIHAQQSESGPEFWLADLGSTNGTLRNGKRLTMPARLGNGDTITILEETFTFHTKFDPAHTQRQSQPPTIPVRALQQCWLLMVDIAQFTTLAREQTPDALGVLVGAWVRDCRDAIETNGGVIDKFLGDALFAYWRHDEAAPARVALAIRLLRARQAQAPKFRIVLHHGAGVIQGAAGGANNLSGPEIIAVFRLEKICANLGEPAALSAAAAAAIGPHLPCRALGEFALDGFPGKHAVYGID
jgi:class 3 adenylate cyclase